MISGGDIYDVLSALVPLYGAMILAYGSVRWWKIFTPDQCSGINSFVAAIAVPFLSFHFISGNDPYAMNFRFLAADSLQKLVILFILFLVNYTRFGNLDWSISFFSLSTLPNTLVMGIPLLRAMYGDFSADLMVQIVVLQVVIWYTLLLFLYEYRGAKALIAEQFSPDIIGSIASVEVESDIVSLSSREGLQANAEMQRNGSLRMVVRRSDSSSRSMASQGLTSLDSLALRDSDLLQMEIYSHPSSRMATPRSLGFKGPNFYPMSSGKVTDIRTVYDHLNGHARSGKFKGAGMTSSDFINTGMKSASYPRPIPTVSGLATDSEKDDSCNNELHMFVWNTTSATALEGDLRHAVRTSSITSKDNKFLNSALHRKTSDLGGTHITNNYASPMRKSGTNAELGTENDPKRPNITDCPSLTLGKDAEAGDGEQGNISRSMPSATVVIKLIIIMVWRRLIRNPNTYASIIGLIWSLISFKWDVAMPKIIEGSITILSNTGLGMSTFSLGLFMALQPKVITCGVKLVLISMVIRFLVGPIVVALTSLVIGLRGDLLRVSILQAALPLGIVPFVFAKQYNNHAGVLSTAVIFGMVVALPITIIYYIILGLF